MSTISGLADTVAGWLKPLPHLPVSGQKWLAENVWWLELIGAILSAIACIMIGFSILVATVFVSAAVGLYAFAGIPLLGVGINVFAAVVSLLFMIITTVVTIRAVGPLKRMEKKGWELLFLTLIIGALSAISSFVMNFDVTDFISSIFSTIIGLGIGAYLLNEIRSYFGVADVAPSAVPSVAPVATTAPINPEVSTNENTPTE